MRGIGSRLVRAEKWIVRSGSPADCRACRGRGMPAMVIEIDGKRKTEPAGCPSCGKVGVVTVMRLTGEDEDIADLI